MPWWGERRLHDDLVSPGKVNDSAPFAYQHSRLEGQAQPLHRLSSEVYQ
jgi:hypothetical protein